MKTDFLASFPIIIDIDVAWGEMDAFGHLNNTIYFRYMESARIAYFEELNIENFSSASGIGPILAHTSCNFIQAVVYPDKVRVGVKTIKLGTTSLTMEHLLVSEKLGIVAKGKAIVVTVDYEKGEKVSLPLELVLNIQSLEPKLII